MSKRGRALSFILRAAWRTKTEQDDLRREDKTAAMSFAGEPIRGDVISARLLQTQPQDDYNGNRRTTDSPQLSSDSLRLAQHPPTGLHLWIKILEPNTEPQQDLDAQTSFPLVSCRRRPTTIIMEIAGRQAHLRLPQTPPESPRPPPLVLHL